MTIRHLRLLLVGAGLALVACCFLPGSIVVPVSQIACRPSQCPDSIVVVSPGSVLALVGVLFTWAGLDKRFWE